MIALLYFFFPGLLTEILIRRTCPKNLLEIIHYIMIAGPYNLLIIVLGYPVNRILYGGSVFQIELGKQPVWSYNKIAYGLTALGIALALAAVVTVFKNKNSVAWVLFGFIAAIFLLGTPLILTLYQMQMQSRVKINEVCSDNFSLLPDAGGYYADYIELYNPAYVEVELGGLCISDSKNELSKYQLPDVLIPARGYFIVYASGDHVYDEMSEDMQYEWEQECHAPFKINSNGEELLLSMSDGTIIDRIKIPGLSYNEVYARKIDGNGDFEVSTATPGISNASVIEPFQYENISNELPSIYIEGNLDRISKDVNAHAEVVYSDGKQQFTCFAKMQIQGGWTANLSAKNNYNVKFYSDSNMDFEKNVCLREDWGNQYRYCLKANILDNTQAKNIVTSRIWNDMLSCRANVDTHLLEAPNGGATDGFPLLVYINGQYKGIYTLNIPKSTWMFAMGNGEKEAIWATKTHALSAGFGEVIDFATQMGTDWDLKYCSTEDDSWAKNSINELIDFVINNDGEAFREGINEYLDMDAAIDYLILLYLSGAGDNMEKNICWITYDGKIWIPSMYDLDHTWELYSTPLIPEIVNGKVESNAGMLLWQRIVDNYPGEISRRYFELREDFLTSEYIHNQFETFMKDIPENVYELEYAAREEGTPGNSQEALEQIMDYVDERFVIFDKFYSDLLELEEQR